jgi:hypothetical protein
MVSPTQSDLGVALVSQAPVSLCASESVTGGQSDTRARVSGTRVCGMQAPDRPGLWQPEADTKGSHTEVKLPPEVDPKGSADT